MNPTTGQANTLGIDDVLGDSPERRPDPHAVIAPLQAGLRELGMRLTTHEICDGLPPPPAMAEFVGVNPEHARQWSVRALERRGLSAAWRPVDLAAFKPAVLPAI